MSLGSTPLRNIWLLTLLIILGVVAIAFASLRIIVNRTALAFNRQQLFLAREAAKSIEGLTENLKTALQTAADLLTISPSEKVCEILFANQRGFMQALFVVASNGQVLCSHPAEAAALLKNVPALPEGIARAIANGNSVVMTDFAGFSFGNRTNLSFVLGVPVAGQSRWLCCIPDFNLIKEKFVYPVRTGDTGYAWMIDGRGVLLAHPNKLMEGRKAIDILKELWPENSAFNLDTIINKEMIKGDEGTGEYTGWHFGEKSLTKKLIAFCPIRAEGRIWSICISAPYTEAMTALLDSVLGPLIFLVCFIAVILAGAVMLTIQERRRQFVNQALRWSQEVFDGITDGITIIDQAYRVLMVNKAVCLWQNKPAEYFVGKPCYAVFQQLEGQCPGCPAQETFATGQPAFRERVSTTLAGKKYYFHLTTFPLKDKAGTTIRVAEYVKDVTREMELRAELIQHERTSMIVKMSSQVAHEIRNPLGTLTLNIDLLEDEIDNYAGSDVTEARNLLKTIKFEIDALHRVLDDYLECKRFPTIKPAQHYINAILREMFSLLEAELRQKRIICTASFESNLPAIEVDEDQLRRAFMNLILNATEAMESGGTLQVTTRSAEAWIEIVFEDSGVGLTPEQIEKIFTPFYTTKSGGTGLGLSITQHIVSEHSGEIVCQSTPGQGTRFIIRLPRNRQQA